MKKNFLVNIAKIAFFVVIVTIAYSCSKDEIISVILPDANTISGTVTFADTGFVSTGGTYLISAFASWPPMSAPSAYDTIKISRNTTTGRWNTAYSYKLKGINDGNYVVTTGFRKNVGGQSPILGVNGCDTTHNSCVVTTTTRVAITGNAGVAGVNFVSWADTTKKLY